MKHIFLAAAAVIGVEAAAVACSCIATDDPVELRRFAADAAQNAVAVVEAEALTSFEAARTGEQMRITRMIAGTAPVHFNIQRQGFPSSASCDVLYKAGERAVMILYPATVPATGTPTFQTSGLCTVHMLQKPVFLEALIKSVGPAAPPAGERG